MTGQLHKKDGAQFAAWSTGAADFMTGYEHGGQSPLTIGVSCRLGNLESTDIALFDTGASYSVISADTAEILNDQFGDEIEKIAIRTGRCGVIEGSLRKLKIHLLANDGHDLEVEGPVFVSKDWSGPTVLGFTGFIEKIRIALDPGVAPGQQVIYFGPVE